MAEERILITVKTYPTPSTRYVETVCTGGINDRGEWRRLYPIRFRYLEEYQQYSVYDVIKVVVEEQSSDGRPESRKTRNDTIKKIERLDSWKSRHQWVAPTIFDSMRHMKEAGKTLAPVRVRRVLDLYALDASAEWSEKQKQILTEEGLFGEKKPLEKIPWDFRFQWVDEDGIEYDSKFLAWEVGETWRQVRSSYNNPVEEIRRRWLEKRCSEDHDLAFFVGNFREHPRHFGVCGVYSPPKKELADEQQLF